MAWLALLGAALLLLASEAIAAAQPAVLDPQAAALRSALQSRDAFRPGLASASLRTFSDRPALAQLPATLAALYSRRAFEPLWIADRAPSAQAAALVQLLCAAGDYGLSADDYGCTALAAQLGSFGGRTETARDAACATQADITSGSPSSASAPSSICFELTLSTALSLFLTEVHSGRIESRRAGFELPPRPDLDLPALLEQLAITTNPSGLIARIEPPYIHYRLLKQALWRYRALAQHPELTALPPLPRPNVRLGDNYAGAPALRKLLFAIGCSDRIDGAEPRQSLQMDAYLVAALKQFQWLHGLAADGVLGKRTYQALAVPFSQRVRQIELTLERWRWLPPPQYPTVLVNIPQFRLFAFDSAQDREQGMLRMDVIVGQEYRHTQTPVFSADMTTIVFRPYWDVPRSIVLREILPQLSRKPDYLDSQHLELVRGGTDASPVVPATPENLRALAAGKLRLRQRPGVDNALGLVKFLFPNAHDVYLHDTPNVQLFKRAQRTFSHGCIRVSDPVALARYVLAASGSIWSDAQVRAAMQGGITVRVPLPHPVHVLILYGTAVASEDGELHFFDDIYGQDRRLEALLGLPPIAPITTGD